MIDMCEALRVYVQQLVGVELQSRALFSLTFAFAFAGWLGNDPAVASRTLHFGNTTLEVTTELESASLHDDELKQWPMSIKDEMKAFQMLAARLNYIAQDDPTIQFAATELCRKMSSPTSQDFSKLKKLVRFLVGVEEVLWEYPWQNERETTAIKIQVDSDWAGCERARRSTSGGCITVGQHPLRTWSSTQSVVATSSAEAELYGMNEGASRGLRLQSMLLELGIEVKLFLVTDSNAAKSFSSTRGLGRMRYVEVKDLWLQELVQKGRLTSQTH